MIPFIVVTEALAVWNVFYHNFHFEHAFKWNLPFVFYFVCTFLDVWSHLRTNCKWNEQKAMYVFSLAFPKWHNTLVFQFYLYFISFHIYVFIMLNGHMPLVDLQIYTDKVLVCILQCRSLLQNLCNIRKLTLYNFVPHICENIWFINYSKHVAAE